MRAEERTKKKQKKGDRKMEKDRRRGKRQGRNVVDDDDDHDESLNILGFAGGSDRVHNAANALESTLLRPSTSSKIINKASL